MRPASGGLRQPHGRPIHPGTPRVSAAPGGPRPRCRNRGDLREARVAHRRQAAAGQRGPVGGVGGAHGERETGRAPRLAGRVREFPPGELGAVPGLGHRLAGGHLQLRVHPERGRAGVRGRHRVRVVEVGAGHLEPGQVLGPAVQRHRREHPHLGRLPGHGDPGERLSTPPLRAARPPHHLADPSVLPVADRLRPLAVAGRPLVGQHHQHRAGRRLQRVRPRGRRAALDTDHQRQHELRRRVAVTRVGSEGAVGGGCRPVVVHLPSVPSGTGVMPGGTRTMPGGTGATPGGTGGHQGAPRGHQGGGRD